MQIDIDQQLTLCITLFNLGFFGGFLHCSSMCSPFVIHQITSRLKNETIESFSLLSRLKNAALLPYHLGRITTYAILGYLFSALGANLRSYDSFNIISGLLLIFASLIIFANLFKSKYINLSLISGLISRIPFTNYCQKSVSGLFSNPTSYRGYLLGVVLGFLPCGLLYSAFAICISINDPFLAFICMAIFGFATFPSLFLVASAGYLFLNRFRNYIKLTGRLVILINSVTICIMGINYLIN